jgi:hypothetical protein
MRQSKGWAPADVLIGRLDRQARIDQRDTTDKIEPALAAEPIEKLLARQSRSHHARQGGNRTRPVDPDPRRNSIPAVVGPSWAACQARQDAISGRICRSYEDFICAYGLRKSDAAGRVWNAYQERAKLAPRRTPPKSAQKPYRSRNLTLSDPSMRRRTVRRSRRHW